MEIRVIIIGDDNQTHPYEFGSYVEARDFLASRCGDNQSQEKELEVDEEVPVNAPTPTTDSEDTKKNDEQDSLEE